MGNLAIPPDYESSGIRRVLLADGTMLRGRLAIELPASMLAVDEPATSVRPGRTRLAFDDAGFPELHTPTSPAPTTSGATPTTILSIPFGDDAAAAGEVQILAFTPGVGLFHDMAIGGAIYTTAGVLAFTGAPLAYTPVNTYGSPPPSWAIVYNTSTKALDLVVTGLAATLITWKASIKFITVP